MANETASRRDLWFYTLALFVMVSGVLLGFVSSFTEWRTYGELNITTLIGSICVLALTEPVWRNYLKLR